jgi:hypothetical protein
MSALPPITAPGVPVGSSATATAPTQAAPAAIALALLQTPATLRQIAQTVLLDAVLQSRDSAGNLTLRTDAGIVTARAIVATSLQAGASVALQLAPDGAGGTNATILTSSNSINQAAAQPHIAPTDATTRSTGPQVIVATVIAPPGESTTASVERHVAQPRASASTASATTLVAANSGDVGALIARAGGGSNQTGPTPAKLVAAAALQNAVAGSTQTETAIALQAGRSLSAASGERSPQMSAAAATQAYRHVGEAPPALTATTPRSSLSPATSGAAPTMSSSSDGKAERPLPVGTTVAIRLAPLPDDRQAATPRAETAQIVARPQARQAVIETPIGRIATTLPASLADAAPGTRVAFAWFPESARAADPRAPSIATTPPPVRGWTGLKQIAETLLESRDPELREAAQRVVPQHGPRLAQQLAALSQALDGEFRRLLGDAAAQKLERAGLADALRAPEALRHEREAASVNGDWRHVTLPFFDGQQLRAIDVYARRRKRSDDGRERDQSRFVVQCEVEQLGAVQIDGLMTSSESKRRLDVIVRTHQPLDVTERLALQELHADACGAMGIAGELAFQVQAKFPPPLLEDPTPHRAVVA